MTVSFSNTDKLRLAFRFCRAPFQIFAYVIGGLAIAFAQKLPLRIYALCAVAKALPDVFDVRDTQYLCPPTRQVYESWIQRRLLQSRKEENLELAGRLRCDIQPLGDGYSSILWFGDRSRAKKVVLFFHGGGYNTPLLNAYMEFLWRAYITAGIEADTEVAVAILEYSLSPGVQYPTQLCQASDALSHLLSSGISPRNIIIGGDSAGGNLTAQLLCHMAWPHPEAVPITLSEPLAGVFLISPWLSTRTADRSFAENGSIDMVSAPYVQIVTAEVLGPDWEKEPNRFSHAFPLDTQHPWMDKLSALTNNMYLSVGYHEVFRDQCVEFVDKVREANPSMELQFDLQEKMAHDFILLETEEKRDGECIEAMKKWVKSMLIAN
ncbi:Abhydrolase-3 domain-containing protein [Fusarium sp. LHS14.1]|nr:Abhydrolase-3 domain-containing protein [Fusarium sp. LHS14.1]